MTPRRFGRYLLTKRISSGGMAEVYLAKATGVQGFEKLLAIKRILPAISEDPDFETMFIDEAKISARLTHTNVGQIFEFGQVDGVYYISMEYIPGRDLRTIQAKLARSSRVMDAPMALHIASRICQALDYAHRQRDEEGTSMEIVHRDVSPPNIIVSYDGAVKLIDFGIAQATSRATKTRAGKLKGKFAYMSPEQVQGMPVDHRTDIFSLGILLHEMLTNRRLFVADNPLNVMQKVRKADVAPPSTINPEVALEVDRIVLKALARQREQRYAWASEMRADIERFFSRNAIVYDSSRLRRWMHAECAEEMEAERQLMIQIHNLSGERRIDALEAPQGAAGVESTEVDAEVVGSDLVGAEVVGSDLVGAEVVDSDLLDAEVVDSDLVGAEVVDSDLVGAEVVGSDLVGAEVVGSDLLDADRVNADLLEALVVDGEMLESEAVNHGIANSDVEPSVPTMTAPSREAPLVGVSSSEGAPTPGQPVVLEHAAHEKPQALSQVPTVLEENRPDFKKESALRAMISSDHDRRGAVVGGALEIDSDAERPLPRVEPQTPVDVRGIEGVVRSKRDKRLTPAFIEAAAQGQISGTQQVEARFLRLTSLHVIILAAVGTLLLAGLALLLFSLSTDSDDEGGGERKGNGTIIVTTEPQAACTVSLDASPKGLVSPGKSLSLSGIPAGMHSVSITCLGFQPFSTSVEVRPAKVSLVEVLLKRE